MGTGTPPWMAHLLLLVFAVLGGVAALGCQLNTDDQFPIQERHFYYNYSELTIILEDSGRVSHRLANRILKILLEDVAGYRKVIIRYCPQYDRQNLTTVLNRISGRMASKHCQPPVPNTNTVPETNVHLEAWVKSDFDMGPWLEWRADSRPFTLIDSGPLGPQGRMGWYVPAYMVQKVWTSSKMVLDHWRALQVTRLSRELSWWGKELEAFDSDYKVGAYLNMRCQESNKGFRRKCATLFAGYQGDDNGVLRSQIESLELYVDIVWLGDRLEEFVRQQATAKKPILFFSWRPNSLTATDAFIRISFPDSSAVHQNGRLGSDFPVNQLTKVTWAAVKTGAPEAFHIIHKMSFTNQEYNMMLGQASTGVQLDKLACDWLKGNELTWKRWLPQSLKIKPKIYLGGLFPLSGKSWSQPGLVEGAKLALDLVNRDDSVLPTHTLELEVKDTQCQYDLATDHVISLVQNRERILAGILGPGCSDPAERVASLSKNFHLMTVSYGAEAEALSDRQKYPFFFRTVPPVQHYSQVYPEVFRELGWGTVGALAEEGQQLPDYHLTLQDKLLHHGITLVKRKFLNNSSLSSSISQILKELKSQKVRVIIADVFSHFAREIMCEAFKQEMTAYQGYVWFLPSWYPDQWWDVEYYNGLPSHLERHQSMENVPCTTAQLRTAIEGHFVLSKAFTAPPKTKVIGGITVKEYKETYALRCGKANVEESNFASFVYDAVWVFAKGLHSLLQENPAALKTLHTERTALAYRKAIASVRFMGVSGQILFDKSDRNADLIMLQFFSNETRVIGHYIPSSQPRRRQQGKLKLDLSAIRWLFPAGHLDPQKKGGVESDCLVESVRAHLEISCLLTYFILILVPLLLIFMGVLLSICIRHRKALKQRNAGKMNDNMVTHDRMKELGLLREEDQFILLVDDWEVPRKDIVLNRELGEGAFGTVMGGEMYKENDGWLSVAVKTLKPDFKVEEKVEFLSEVNTMKKLGHPNVVKLLGVCTHEVIYAIMEFMLHGNLKTFLLSRRHLVGQGVKEAEDTKPERLTQMAIDVAQGLDYLHANRFVHRDLACRNCLVHANKTVKIGDFGMTRHVSDTDIYRFARKGMLPVRWTAPESLKDGIYTAKSDIWSFGVLVFEIVTFGSFPYQGMSNKEVLDYVGRGLPLPLPDKCPRELQTFIKWCMSYNSDFRPDLTAILTELHLNSSYLTPCLDAPAFSVEHDDTDSLEIPLANTQSSHNLGSSINPFTSNTFRGRSQSFHEKPISSKKKSFPIPGFTSFTKIGRTSTSSKKSPTSSRSSSRCSGIISNSMCGIHTCGIGAGWISSRPPSVTVDGNWNTGSNRPSNNIELDHRWTSGSLYTRAEVHSPQNEEEEDEEEGEEAGEESGVSSLLGLKPVGGSCSDVIGKVKSSFPQEKGSHRSLSSLQSHGQSPLLTPDKGRLTGSSGYLSQNSRAEGRHICQTVTSL